MLNTATKKNVTAKNKIEIAATQASGNSTYHFMKFLIAILELLLSQASASLAALKYYIANRVRKIDFSELTTSIVKIFMWAKK